VLFSLEWLCELAAVRAAPERIGAALVDRGLTVEAVVADDGDHVLDLDIPANRPDCMGHLGVAREIAAAFGAPPPPPPTPAPGATAVAGAFQVRVENTELCPRYTARLVRGLRVAPSPAPLARRLARCGMRPINNVVDISNLILLQLGQPVHFFDFRRLAAAGDGCRRIAVRAAHPGERLVTLDGVPRTLDPAHLVIADDRGAVALAGIIGGAGSEIGPETVDVLVESASFDARSIRATSRALGLRTEASQRFARGSDPEAALQAQHLAAAWLGPLCAEVGAASDCYPVPRPERTLALRHAALARLLGLRPDPERVRQALAALGLAPLDADESGVRVRVPSHRLDLEREADLIEEIARHLGYEQIPCAAAEVAAPEPPGPAAAAEGCRDVLRECGFHEAIGYAMIGAGQDDPFVPAGEPAPLGLTNPLAEPAAWLRRSLLAGLLQALGLNLRRGTRDVRLFEVARVFRTGGAGPRPTEIEHAALVWSGAAEAPHWSLPRRLADLFDLLGVVERLFESLAADVAGTRSPEGPAGLHPGEAVTWRGAGGTVLGFAGRLHPALAREFPEPVYVAELDLEALGREPGVERRFARISNLPAVFRDLSLILKPETSWARTLAVLRSIAAPAPVRFEVVDRYEGPPLPPRAASLTVRFVLSPAERTLTDPETEAYRLELVAALGRELGAVLRG